MAESRKSIAFVNGPNLNRLGTRKPHLYGRKTLEDVGDDLTLEAAKLGFNLIRFQSNHEGELIDFIQSLSSQTVGIILNPGALMMAGYSLRDAIEDCAVPVIEVHISNIWAREPFRHHSVISAVCRGVLSGFGVLGYSLALKALGEICQNGDDSKMLTLPRKLTAKSGLMMESLTQDAMHIKSQSKSLKETNKRAKKTPKNPSPELAENHNRFTKDKKTTRKPIRKKVDTSSKDSTLKNKTLKNSLRKKSKKKSEKQTAKAFDAGSGMPLGKKFRPSPADKLKHKKFHLEISLPESLAKLGSTENKNEKRWQLASFSRQSLAKNRKSKKNRTDR